MIKKTIEFKDLDGNKVTKDLYFHISKIEGLKKKESEFVQLGEIGKDLERKQKRIQKLGQERGDVELSDDPFSEENTLLRTSAKSMVEVLDMLIDLSYGERSEDGMSFIREGKAEAFRESLAYEAFIFQMMTDPEQITNFVNSLLNK